MILVGWCCGVTFFRRQTCLQTPPILLKQTKYSGATSIHAFKFHSPHVVATELDTRTHAPRAQQLHAYHSQLPLHRQGASEGEGGLVLYSTDPPSHLSASQLSSLGLEREFELHRLQAFKGKGGGDRTTGLHEHDSPVVGWARAKWNAALNAAWGIDWHAWR